MPKCKHCKQKLESSNSLQGFCKPEHAIEWLNSPAGKHAQQKAKDKKRKTEEREAKAKKLDYYRKHVSWQHKQTQLAFNKMRKLEELKWFKDRGIEPYCISCLKTNMDWCAGHFKTVGASGALRYEPNNVHLQCNARCNLALSGNLNGTSTTIGYRAGLAHRFGEEDAVKRLKWLDEHQSDKHKWTCEELEEMRKGFNERIRQLQRDIE